MNESELARAVEQLAGDGSLIEEVLSSLSAESAETELSLDSLILYARNTPRLRSIGRAQVWVGLQRMAQLGFGRTVLGRKGQPTRLVLPPGLTVGRIVRAIRQARHRPLPVPQALQPPPEIAHPMPPAEMAPQPETQLSEHFFRLRPGLVVTLRLPDNLTPRDVEKLTGFLRLLAEE
jgi:hypothetical protein